jgi:hypothetical protein
MSTPKNPALPEIPRDDIIEASKHHSDCRMRVKRRDNKNRWAMMTSNVNQPVIELLNIDEWIGKCAGGGEYRIETEVIDDPSRFVVKPFMCAIEGPSRKFVPPGEDRNDMDSHHRPNFTGSGDAEPETTTGRMAREALDAQRHAFETEKRLREEERRKHSDEAKRMQREQDRLREEMRENMDRMSEEAHKREMQSIRELITTRQNEPARPAPDWAALAVALAPIGVALIEAGHNRRASEMEQSTVMATSNNQMITAFMSKPQNESELIKLLPTLVPVLQSFLSMRDPSKQAEMWSVLGEQMLTQASLAGEMMQSIAASQPDAPPWMGMVTELFGGIERYAQAILENQQGGSTRTAKKPSSEIVQGTPEGAVPASADGAPPMRPATEPAAGTSQEEKMAHVMPQLPSHFQNREWAEIIYFILMGDTSNIGGIGEATAELLEKLREAGAVPPELYPVFEDRAKIGPLFFDLVPCAADYRYKLVRATLSVMRGPASKPTAAPNIGNNGPGPSGMVEPPEEARIGGPGSPTRTM